MVYTVDPKNCLSGAWPVAAQLQTAPGGTPVTDLAARLVAAAGSFDLSRVEKTSLTPAYAAKGIRPNFTTAPYVFFSDGKPGSDSTAQPLQPGEQWNAAGTRRGTLCHVYYRTDREGFPVNPYIKTGVRGPGMLWHFGPNLAVDNGILSFHADDKGVMTAYLRGIIRGDNKKPAFAGGFVKMEPDVTGAYRFDPAADHRSRCEEFFEEMISGSITLRPDYEARKDAALTGHAAVENETALKMEQVRALDPGFWQRLDEVVGRARVCYQGIVLCSGRNTNSAWIETSLGWYMMGDTEWNYIKGGDPQKFGYALSAGDDAEGTICRKIDGQFANEAAASHGALFGYMAASWLLDAQEKKITPDPAIMRQFEELAAHMEREARPSATPPPRPQQGHKF